MADPYGISGKCAGCAWFYGERDKEAKGQCVRFPPNQGTDNWPIVSGHRTCGEYKKYRDFFDYSGF